MLIKKLVRADLYAQGVVLGWELASESPLQESPVSCSVPGFPGLAEPGSFRLSAEGRPVLGVKAEWIVPVEVPVLPESRLRVEALERQATRLEKEKLQLEAEYAILNAIRPQPRVTVRTELALRIAEAQKSVALLEERLQALDERLIRLGVEVLSVKKELQKARLALEPPKSQESAGYTVHFSLGAGAPLPRLLLSAYLRAAAWWPIWRVRTQGTERVSLELAAQVVQATGEDWKDIAVSFCSADRVADIRLPELASLRFGRAQAAKPPPRPPPMGLDRLFESYDRFKTPVTYSFQPSPPLSLDEVLEADGEDLLMDLPAAEPCAPPPVQKPDATQFFALAKAEAAPAPRSGQAFPAMSAAPKARSLSPASMVAGLMAGAAEVLTGEGGYGEGRLAPPPPPPLEPSDGWLDYERLQLGGPDHPIRGRLRRPEGDSASTRREAAWRSIQAQARPIQSRFDHSYSAAAPISVAADAKPQLVPVLSASSSPGYRYRCIPRESTDVFKTLEFKNPLPGPVVGGMVEVWIEGALLTSDSLQSVAKGGKIWVGMGVEERIKLARNVKVEESKAGVFGGSVAVTHTVTIELLSSLSSPASVEVMERLPVTDNKELEITRLESSPEPEDYDQAEAGKPIRGGLCWRLLLQPDVPLTISYRYRLCFSSRSTISGGVRREP
jgi:hypothetical protein